MTPAKLKTVKVSGTNKKHKILLYALSTCAWCRLAKRYLSENKIEYEYVDVDLCTEKNRQNIRNDISERGGEPSYPTIIVDDRIVITGFRKDKLSEALGV
ncbi:MAG TPA: glutaredoxin family protein [Candidatus Bathyarchaeia archaeon]|nr:glutaredoxin family protein [Candidatus Bathyarchaeia archaeon]